MVLRILTLSSLLYLFLSYNLSVTINIGFFLIYNLFLTLSAHVHSMVIKGILMLTASY